MGRWSCREFNHQAVPEDGHMQKLIAARLARKSNDEGQKSADLKSVQLQLDEMAKFAATHGWEIDEKYTYVDDGVSGADFANRHGLQRLMAALDPKPPFKVLLITEIS